MSEIDKVWGSAEDAVADIPSRASLEQGDTQAACTAAPCTEAV